MSHFRVIEHTVRAHHIRVRLGAVKPGHENELRLTIKQYVPPDNPDSKEGDPQSPHLNIWIADVVQQGQSGILNEGILGDDPDWHDHARDIFSMITQFRDKIRQPIVGIGRSMGGMQLAHLSLTHPALFSALVLVDPTIARSNVGLKFAQASIYRRDLWRSRAEAVQKFNSNPFYQARVWTSRTPYAPVYPVTDQNGPGAVTLTTTKAQELFFYCRLSYIDERSGLRRGDPKEDMHPDDIDEYYPFYRPEPVLLFCRLPGLKPPVLYLFGGKSELSTPEARREKMEITGTGVGGSGGVKAGAVEEVVLPAGHLVPMEPAKETAQATGDFIHSRLSQWEVRLKRYQDAWRGVPQEERVQVDKQWEKHLGVSRRPKL
ncbi:Alpha/beta hydrolase family-domain-containing protein [Aspergillus foveolatus]|uniref:Alpha/beta hydrolase family-domain-containing protein n=1 Tax=Aspergillus foveolatus TaxID=210207 RepID=UPI003CCD653A